MSTVAKVPYILAVILSLQIIYLFYTNGRQCDQPQEVLSTGVGKQEIALSQKSQHAVEIDDAIEILDARNESRKAIFFIESSRRGTITPRQICAVESTATYNPDADIFVLILDPPDDPALARDEQVLTLLRHHKNVRLLRVESATYYVGTPLQEWSTANRINTSVHRIEDASDILRIVTILMYGGIYLDLDFVIQKSLASLPPNWLSFELGSDVCNGALGFTKGHPMVLMMAKEQAENFNGKIWGHNGPSMISRVMHRTCGLTNSEIFETGKKCKDVVVFKPDKFFPIAYPGWQRYFDEAVGNEVVELAKDYLGVHLYNYLSHGTNVTLRSSQAYGLLAQKHCPRAYWGCVETF